MPTLTTDNLAAYASVHLATLRQAADREHLAAQLMPGSHQAEACARRISAMVTEVHAVSLLVTLARQHGDDAAAEALNDEIDAAVNNMITQSLEARLISIPREAA